MKDIKVSIITVCYNSEKTIRRTIESVLNQTYPNVEYIIVDGASSDSTLDIIKEYESAFEGRLRYISQPDEGIYYAMNKGIEMASGDLVGIINSDDYYEKEAVAIMVREYGRAMDDDSSQKYVILYGMTRILDNDREKSISLSRHEYLRETMISHPSSFVSKALYNDLGGYDTEFVSASDYDFMLRMSENKNVTFLPIYELISNFSLGGMCSSSKAYYDLLKVQKKHRIISESLYRKTMIKCRMYDFWVKGRK